MIRPVRYRDLPALKAIFAEAVSEDFGRRELDISSQFGRWQQMYPLVRALSLFPNPYQYLMNLHLLEENGSITGFIQTSPGNRQRTRWHVDYIAVSPAHRGRGIAKRLLDHVFDLYPEVKSVTMEVDTRNTTALGLAGKKGFRRYATLYYYQLSAESLGAVQPVPAPEGLRPYRSADSGGLLDLYTACTPAPVRLIDSRSAGDFEQGLIERTLSRWRRQFEQSEERRYVIQAPDGGIVAYLRLVGQRRPMPHSLQLMVHPGYAQLLDGLIHYGLGALRGYSNNMVLAWAPDYQPARKEAIEAAGLTLLTADYLLVRDTVMTIRMPLAGLQKVDDPAFKPAFCETLG